MRRGLRRQTHGFPHLEILAEPGGAVAPAGGPPRPERGAVGVILSGGNADPALFSGVRYLTFL
ncbi:MAG: hypothetical protein RMK90_13560 [Acetobacteraceae bacterium]|nr:hypothetical protein [Acetobacteraceae bacterium]